MIAIKIIRAEVASIKTLIECKVVERGFTEAKCFFLKFAIAMSKQKICKIEFSSRSTVGVTREHSLTYLIKKSAYNCTVDH